MISLNHITDAQNRLVNYLVPTPLEPAPGLGNSTQPAIWLKLENANRTHSFKIRGALNAALLLDDAAKARGLIAASSGNHAQALAYAAKMAGAAASICMPAHTPKRKVDGVRRWGATALTDYANYDEAESDALRLAQSKGKTFVSAYNNPDVIAGAGTIGLEILDERPDVQRVIVPVSGGGLISGVAAAIKLSNPAIEVVGVGAEHAPSMYNEFYGTDHAEKWETLAEALSGAIEPGSVTVPLVKQYVDRIVLVDEQQIAAAMRWCVDVAGWLVEGGGSVGVAAVLQGIVEDDGKQTAIVISGGNVDGDTLRRVIGTTGASDAS